jgi:signal transduction histidine kinase
VTTELLRMEIIDAGGVHTVRRMGRDVAGTVRLDHHDQVRIAVALSEIGRAVYACAGRAGVRFLLEGDEPEARERPALTIEFIFAPRAGEPRPLDGDAAAARLVDMVEEEAMHEGTEGRSVVRLRKYLPTGVPQVTEAALQALRDRLARLRPVPALEELRTQNAELIEALEQAERQRAELRALNRELEETNKGVMALYTELSEELENTNRGVVALHTELDEKSRQLSEVSQAKNRFWANISHELRTPVNGVIGLSRLLLDPGADELTDEQRHQITLIREAAETMLSLVNELLDMAKAEQGRLRPEPGPVEVPTLLDKVAALLRPMAERGGLRLDVDASGAPSELFTDEEMLSRILRNLVGNSVKFTREGGVRIEARAAPEHVDFVVSDTGVGIPEQDRERVFEEFYQVPGSGAGGTGLGLSYARRLARLLGGDLTLRSTVGEGTTVTVSVPPYPAPSQEDATRERT